jgi:twitching motility two-component system response regulator PilH
MTIQKVLIVDDSKTELMHLTGLLQKNGFSVKTAENAEDAFRRLAEEKPDLILMDVVMPGQNGFQLTRAISRDPLYKDVPIFMCTSKTQETDRVWGLRQGARDYITKPVESHRSAGKDQRLELIVHPWPVVKHSGPFRAALPTGCRRLAQQAQLQLGLPSRPRTPDTCFHSITRAKFFHGGRFRLFRTPGIGSWASSTCAAASAASLILGRL